MVVSKAQGAVIAASGVVLLITGIGALAHCDQLQQGFFGSFCLRNDWAGVGALCLIVGIVTLLLGLILPFATQPEPARPAYPYGYGYAPVAMMPGYPMGYAPYPQPYGAYPPNYGAYPGAPVHNPYGAPPPPAYAPAAQAPPTPVTAASPVPPRSCFKCGNPVTSQFCASCGAAQW